MNIKIETKIIQSQQNTRRRKEHKNMQRIHTITTRNGVDVGYHESPIHPLDGEGRVGKRGLDKTLKFEDILNIAYKTFTNDGNRANIIVKAGPNAKWYLKYCPLK